MKIVYTHSIVRDLVIVIVPIVFIEANLKINNQVDIHQQNVIFHDLGNNLAIMIDNLHNKGMIIVINKELKGRKFKEVERERERERESRRMRAVQQ